MGGQDSYAPMGPVIVTADEIGAPPGDVIEAHVAGIGSLRNPVVNVTRGTS